MGGRLGRCEVSSKSCGSLRWRNLRGTGASLQSNRSMRDGLAGVDWRLVDSRLSGCGQRSRQILWYRCIAAGRGRD